MTPATKIPAKTLTSPPANHELANGPTKRGVFIVKTPAMAPAIQAIIPIGLNPDLYQYSDEFPLNHSFSEGIYTREIFIKKGMFVIGKIHKHEHTFF